MDEKKLAKALKAAAIAFEEKATFYDNEASRLRKDPHLSGLAAMREAVGNMFEGYAAALNAAADELHEP